MSGQELLETLALSTGLPTQAVQKELSRLIEQSGLDNSTITLDQLREILANYLQDVLLEAKFDSVNSIQQILLPFKTSKVTLQGTEKSSKPVK